MYKLIKTHKKWAENIFLKVIYLWGFVILSLQVIEEIFLCNINSCSREKLRKLVKKNVCSSYSRMPAEHLECATLMK